MDLLSRLVRQRLAMATLAVFSLGSFVCPTLVAAYIEELGVRNAPPTVQQNLAAIRTLFDFLVTGQVMPFA